MKEITLIFNGLGYNNFCQANIVLYNNLNQKVYEGHTYNGRLNIKLKKKQIYKLMATIPNDTIKISFYVDKNSKYCFSFRRSFIIPNSLITFRLIDYYYNLPIESGELILWQRQ